MSSQPWIALGMSRANWYREGKPTTKPTRVTQKQIAQVTGVSVRTVQRDLAKVREEDRQANIARIHEYMAQGYTQDEACRLRASELRAITIEKLIKKDGGLVTFAEVLNYRQNGAVVK
jgi:uncharacterized protein YoaH (UPF0181 family)